MTKVQCLSSSITGLTTLIIFKLLKTPVTKRFGSWWHSYIYLNEKIDKIQVDLKFGPSSF